MNMTEKKNSIRERAKSVSPKIKNMVAAKMKQSVNHKDCADGWQEVYREAVTEKAKSLFAEMGLHEFSPKRKIRNKELKALLWALKHKAVLLREFEFAVELRSLEKKFFTQSKSKKQ